MCISQKPGVKREQISKIKFQNRTKMPNNELKSARNTK